jgi:hypothetical protein
MFLAAAVTSLLKLKMDRAEHLAVAIRVRPALPRDERPEEVVEVVGDTVKVSDAEHFVESHYDRVFPSSSSQTDLFDFVSQSVAYTGKGYNCTIFAYGQTGSGKTFTMFGSDWENNNPARQEYYASRTARAAASMRQDPLTNPVSRGVIPRCVSLLFETLREGRTFYCSFLQIYNDKLFDLLQDPTRQRPLLIREDAFNGIFVENLAEFVVQSEDDCFGLLLKGDRNRAVRQTKFNDHSSRSHTLLQVLVETDRADKRGNLKRAKLNLVDLAGSERFVKDGLMKGEHISELTNINSSLTTLGKVIAALASGHRHIPYRESKLTRLLQDSLGVNTRTILIATVSPTLGCLEETLSTLKFADRARQVMVTIKKNEVSATSDKLVSRLQQEIQHLKNMLGLKRRGGLQELHQEMWALRQENKKLKTISTGLTVEDVERLKEENKRMRIELQNMGTSSRGTNESMFITEAHSNDLPSQTSSEFGVLSSPDYREARSASKIGNVPRAVDIVAIVQKTGGSLQATLEAVRKQDLKHAAADLATRLTTQGRCPTCTLKVPCKHYQSQSDLPKVDVPAALPSPVNISTQLPNIFTKRDLSQPPCLPRPPSNALNTSLEAQRSLSVRYRAKDNTFKVDGGLLAEQRKAEQERRRLKEAEQRLKTLEMLEIYREEKLRKEIEKIEEEKNLEEAELRRQSAHERRHQEYLQAQKQRLIEHSLSKQERQQQDAAKRYEEELRKKQGSARRRRELDKKKEPVQGYKHKKKVIESIINSQLTGLGLNSMELDELCKENYEAEQSS